MNNRNHINLHDVNSFNQDTTESDAISANIEDRIQANLNHPSDNHKRNEDETLEHRDIVTEDQDEMVTNAATDLEVTKDEKGSVFRYMSTMSIENRKLSEDGSSDYEDVSSGDKDDQDSEDDGEMYKSITENEDSCDHLSIFKTDSLSGNSTQTSATTENNEPILDKNLDGDLNNGNDVANDFSLISIGNSINECHDGGTQVNHDAIQENQGENKDSKDETDSIRSKENESSSEQLSSSNVEPSLQDTMQDSQITGSIEPASDDGDLDHRNDMDNDFSLISIDKQDNESRDNGTSDSEIVVQEKRDDLDSKDSNDSISHKSSSDRQSFSNVDSLLRNAMQDSVSIERNEPAPETNHDDDFDDRNNMDNDFSLISMGNYTNESHDDGPSDSRDVIQPNRNDQDSYDESSLKGNENSSDHLSFSDVDPLTQKVDQVYITSVYAGNINHEHLSQNQDTNNDFSLVFPDNHDKCLSEDGISELQDVVSENHDQSPNDDNGLGSDEGNENRCDSLSFFYVDPLPQHNIEDSKTIGLSEHGVESDDDNVSDNQDDMFDGYSVISTENHALSVEGTSDQVVSDEGKDDQSSSDGIRSGNTEGNQDSTQDVEITVKNGQSTDIYQEHISQNQEDLVTDFSLVSYDNHEQCEDGTSKCDGLSHMTPENPDDHLPNASTDFRGAEITENLNQEETTVEKNEYETEEKHYDVSQNQNSLLNDFSLISMDNQLSKRNVDCEGEDDQHSNEDTPFLNSECSKENVATEDNQPVAVSTTKATGVKIISQNKPEDISTVHRVVPVRNFNNEKKVWFWLGFLGVATLSVLPLWYFKNKFLKK